MQSIPKIARGRLTVSLLFFQVLFCRLTEEQRELYQQYLNSREVQAILAGNYKVILCCFRNDLAAHQLVYLILPFGVIIEQNGGH